MATKLFVVTPGVQLWSTHVQIGENSQSDSIVLPYNLPTCPTEAIAKGKKNKDFKNFITLGT